MANIKTETGHFINLNKTLGKIAQMFLEKENLCKLLYYNDNDPLSHDNLSGDEKAGLLHKHIRLTPQIPFNDKEGSFIIVVLDNFKLNKTNFKFIDHIIGVDVFCHLNQWQIKQGLRPFYLLEEVHSVLDNSNLFGIGKVNFESSDFGMLTSEFGGYTAKYRNIEFDSL